MLFLLYRAKNACAWKNPTIIYVVLAWSCAHWVHVLYLKLSSTKPSSGPPPIDTEANNFFDSFSYKPTSTPRCSPSWSWSYAPSEDIAMSSVGVNWGNPLSRAEYVAVQSLSGLTGLRKLMTHCGSREVCVCVISMDSSFVVGLVWGMTVVAEALGTDVDAFWWHFAWMHLLTFLFVLADAKHLFSHFTDVHFCASIHLLTFIIVLFHDKHLFSHLTDVHFFEQVALDLRRPVLFENKMPCLLAFTFIKAQRLTLQLEEEGKHIISDLRQPQ